MIKTTKVDAVLDSVDGGDFSVAVALADLLDECGEWDWSDDSEHDPCDRLAVLESTGAYWLVYRGSEPDEATRYESSDVAHAALKEQRRLIKPRG
jgi:hypothetical protein